LLRVDSRRTIDFCTISAKSRDSSILLLSAIARTISGRLCMVRAEAEFSRRGDRLRLGFDAKLRK
jgi:hypothetical protein